MSTPHGHRRIVAACCAVLFAPLTFPLLTGRVFTKDDLAAWHLPFRYLYAGALRAGDTFLWTPAVRSGLYIHGEGEAGLAHPLHLLLYRTLPLGVAFNLEIIATYVALLTGTGFLFLRAGLDVEAAWFGAMLFAFSGFTLFNLMHVNHIATVAHMPWLLLAAHALLTSDNRRTRAIAFAGAALVLGSQLLVGHPQYVWMTGIALACLTLTLLLGGAPVSRALWLGGALACGVLVGAVQLLPTLDFAQESVRQSWGPAQSMSFSLSPLNLIQLWSPFAFRFRVVAPRDEALIVHEFIVYNGAFCTVALAWIAARWREQARRGTLLALLAFAALSLMLAFGRHGVIYPWLAGLPGIRDFRAPARHLVLFHLAISGIAAIAFEDLAGVVRRRERIPLVRLSAILVTAAASVATTLAAAALSSSSWAVVQDVELSGLWRGAPWMLVVVAMAALVVLAARGAGWAVPAAIVLSAVDLGAWGYSYVYRWGPLRTIDELASAAQMPPGARPGDLFEPMPGAGPVNLPILRGAHLVNGYFGIETASALDPMSISTMRVAGVSWRPVDGGWTRVEHSMPRARLLTRAIVSRDVRAGIQAIDVSRVALVAAPVPALSGDAGSAQVVVDRPGDIVVDTIANDRQLLVVSERFHPGWQTTQDGAPAQTITVYGDYIGSIVGSGRHRVEFTFAPASTRNGLRATLAGLALTLAGTAVLW